MRPISRYRAHMPQGKPERVVSRPWLDSEYQTGQETNDEQESTHRLDVELVRRGVEHTRTKAQRLIESGAVSVEGHVETKASRKVSSTTRVDVMPQGHEYVSRGAYKLLGALEEFTPHGLASPRGRQCLDIGASTGGFTQVLLEHGAAHVVALDVGHGQLAESILNDERVTVMNGTNIRTVTPTDLPYAPTYIVSDVSFISLTYVLPVIAQVAAPLAEIVVLVKPQFEVGRTNLGKDGIVTDPDLRAQSLQKVTDCAQECGLNVMGSALSPLEGTHGNVEYLLWLRAPGLD